MTDFRILLSVFVLTIFAACGVTQPVRPIEVGSTEITASLGGPIIPVGDIAFPVPYLNLGAQYGYHQNFTLFGNAHITALLFKDIGFDGGAAARIVSEEGLRPDVTVNGRAYFFWDAFRGNSIRVYPAASLTGSYSLNERSLLYFGVDNLVQLSDASVFVSPFAGYSFPISGTMVMQVETKWVAMNHDTRHGIFEGIASIGGNGNMGLYIGFQYGLK
ncbi:MAG: hypothetical protein WCW35_06955 [Bacteroidota bacterium]